LCIVNLFTPTLILPCKKWKGWNEKRLKQPPPPLSSPVNGEEELRGLENDTPTLILPRQWGGRVIVEFLFCALLIYSLPPFVLLRQWGGRVWKDFLLFEFVNFFTYTLILSRQWGDEFGEFLFLELGG
jgi:hypothetical protein